MTAIDPAAEVPCPLCCEPINARAKLCKHCKSDLTWRRNVSISQTTIAIAGAMVAIMIALLPLMRDALKPQDADIQAWIVKIDSESAEVVLKNGGKSVGAIEDINVRAKYSKPYPWMIEMTLTPRGTLYVKADETITARLNQLGQSSSLSSGPKEDRRLSFDEWATARETVKCDLRITTNFSSDTQDRKWSPFNCALIDPDRLVRELNLYESLEETVERHEKELSGTSKSGS